jgi:hypothetical protein
LFLINLLSLLFVNRKTNDQMGNTCKSAKTDLTIRAIAEPSVPIVSKIPANTKLYQSINGSTIHEEEEEEEV